MPVSQSRDGVLTVLSLDDTDRRNTLTSGSIAELSGHLADCGNDPSVRAVVLTHSGNTFCAGADLQQPPPPQELTALLRQILTLPKPVVARVDGHVRAGGLGLLGVCDIAAAGRDSSFAFTEVRIGVAPALISLPLLHRLDPTAAARWFLSGETFGAEEAVRTGLITVAEPDVDRALTGILDGLRKASPQGLAATKRLLTAKVLDGFDTAAAELAELSARLFAGEDAREGITAFLQRRPPAWAE